MSELTHRMFLFQGEFRKLAFTPAACVCLEEVTEVPLLQFIGTLRPGRPKQIYQTLYALGASDRASRGDATTFAEALDHYPPFNLSDPAWLKVETLVFELVSPNFFGKSWSEMKAIAEAAQAAAQASIEESSSGTIGPTSDTTTSASSPDSSGTGSTTDTSAE